MKNKKIKDRLFQIEMDIDSLKFHRDSARDEKTAKEDFRMKLMRGYLIVSTVVSAIALTTLAVIKISLL